MRLCPALPGNPRRYIEGESPRLWRGTYSLVWWSLQVAARWARMTYRLLMIVLCLLHAVFALAQSTTDLPLVGVLRLDTPESVKPVATIFRNTLSSLGQVDGRNIRIDFRLASGHAERFPELAQQLVREKASVIVASGDAAVRAAQQATKTIPIIAIVDDIVAAGLIDSLARPGANTTGVQLPRYGARREETRHSQAS